MIQSVAAIVDDDAVAVGKLLLIDPNLATRLIAKRKLCTSSIFHWIYAGDTGLHLAAAGYRVEIVRLLLNAGADPNAAKNRRRSSPLHYADDGAMSPAWNQKRQVDTIRW
jgi:ankyrin repeat protein